MKESIIYETMVSYNKTELDTLLTITEKELLFQKKVGLFKKKFKVIENVSIEDIGIKGRKVQIKAKKNRVTLYTKRDVYDFDCEDLTEAIKVADIISKQRLEVKSTKKNHKVLKLTRNVAGAAIGIAGVTAAIAAIIKKNSDNLNKAVDSLEETEKTMIEKELK